MIPKIIHYCWFGGKEKPEKVIKCIQSWKKYLPEYEIREWNEETFAINDYPYARYCYENEKWAFLSDFARLVIVEQCGGIYLDTDVEVVKSFDDLLDYEAFFGFESNEAINTGEGFGAVRGHKTVTAMKEVYLQMLPDNAGCYPLKACPALNTQVLLPLGLMLNGERQKVAGAEIFPIEYFNPYDDPTGVLKITPNTFSIHWYSKSWIGKGAIIRSVLMKPIHRIFGVDCFSWIRKK